MDNAPYVPNPRLRDVVANGALADVKARIGPQDKDWRGQGSQSLLFWAAKRSGHPDETIAICHYLLESIGLDVDLQSAGEKPFWGRTPLFLACQFAPARVMAFILERQANVHHQDRAGQTPLFFAATGCLEGLKLLLERRADANHQDQHGQTPLFYAAKVLQPDHVMALLKHIEATEGSSRAAVSVRDKLIRQTPLFYAAHAGAAETCSLLIEKRCDVDGVDGNEQSALFWAAKAGRSDIVRLLLEQRADADLRDKLHQTPLFYAVDGNMIEACRVLIEKGGANPRAQSINGHSPLNIALGLGAIRSQDLISLFQPYADIVPNPKLSRKNSATSTPQKKRRKGRAADGDGASAVTGTGSSTVSGASAPLVPESLAGELSQAILHGSAADVRRLTDAGHDLKAENLQSLLSLAAGRPDGDDGAAESICRLLVEEHGAPPACAADGAASPLSHAVRGGMAKCARCLLEARCELQQRDGDGQTPLFVAAGLEAPECLALLLESRGDANVKDARGRTPLFTAALCGRVDTLGVLLRHGACADVLDGESNHILDGTAPACVPALVKAKCNPNASSSSGLPALSIAVRQGDVAKAQVLLEARADVQLREERSGRTALHEAVEARQLKALRALLESDVDANVQDAAGMTPVARAKELRWAAAVREIETAARQRRNRAERAQQAQAAAQMERLRQLTHVARHGPLEQLRDLLKTTSSDALHGEMGAALLQAAAARHPSRGNPVEVCRFLIEEKGLDPCGKNSHGDTGLFSAAYAGNMETCSYLVQLRCEVDGCNVDERTALFAAASSGHVDVIRALLDARADACKRDTRSQTALFFAACKSAECASLLLEARAEASTTDSLGQGPLFYASREGMDAAVRLLVDGRADVNRMDSQGKPALYFAIHEGQAATAALLLEDCDAWPPEDRSRGGCDLVEMARSRGLAGIVRQLQAKASLREALLGAAKRGAVEEIDRAIAQGASVRATNAAGWSALHCAAAQKDVDGLQSVRQLVEAHGADVNALDRQRQTPLFVAARNGSHECIAYLLDRKCDPCLADDRGDTALFDAAQKRRPTVAALLLERGASAGHRNATKQTAAFRAANAGSAEALRCLLEGGAGADDADVEGRTGLFGVQDVDCARLLLGCRCDVNARDCNARTALFDAEGPAITRLLLDARAAVNARDRHQQTALFSASARGDAAAMRVLIEAGVDGSMTDILGQTALFGAAAKVSLDVVRMLVCEAWVDPAMKDCKGLTAVQVVRKARPAPKAGVVDYLARVARTLGVSVPIPGSGTAASILNDEKPRCYRFAFIDPSDDTGVTKLAFGTPQYKEALANLVKQCPSLRMEMWQTSLEQPGDKADAADSLP